MCINALVMPLSVNMICGTLPEKCRQVDTNGRKTREGVGTLPLHSFIPLIWYIFMKKCRFGLQ